MWLGTQNIGNNSHCKLLLHMNGADDGTTFTDDSKGGSSNTITATNAVTKTGTKKLGSASGYFDGTSYLSVTPITDFDFLGSPFTVSFWVNFTDASGGQATLSDLLSLSNTSYTNSLNLLYRSDLSTPNFMVGIKKGGWTGYTFNLVTALSDATWHHVALTKTGTTVDLFIDGISLGSQTVSSTYETLGSINDVNIGYSKEGNQHYFIGYIDEFTVHKGIVLYNRNFTPPARQM